MALQIARFLRRARNFSGLSSSLDSAWAGSTLVRSISTATQSDIGTINIVLYILYCSHPRLLENGSS